VISDKQASFLKTKPASWMILSGAVRSGKTWASNIYFKGWVEERAVERERCLITGRTGDTAYANVAGEILKLAENDGTIQDWELRSRPRELVYLPKRIHIPIVGAWDEGAEGRIRGMTFQGGCCDEVTLYPRSFFERIVSGVSAGERVKLLTCNPDAPGHFIKARYIDEVERGGYHGKVWYFGLDDNPVLTDAYKADIKRSYQGVAYDRFILGKWVAAEGAIYTGFSRELVVDEIPEADKKRIVEYVLGIDWGFSADHPMAIIVMGVTNDGVYYQVDEWVESGRQIDRSIRVEMEARGWYALPIWAGTGWRTEAPSIAYADAARPDNIAQFADVTGITTVPSRKPSKPELIAGVGRKHVKREDGRYGAYYLSKCVRSIGEREAYRYKAGTELPHKEGDHTIDAEQYIYSTREGGGRFVVPEYAEEEGRRRLVSYARR
jgi:PBSX family phage terminase large subunit